MAVRRLPRMASPAIEAAVREWYDSFVPTTLHGRLVAVVGQEFWHQKLHGDHGEWERASRNSPGSCSRHRRPLTKNSLGCVLPKRGVSCSWEGPSAPQIRRGADRPDARRDPEGGRSRPRTAGTSSPRHRPPPTPRTGKRTARSARTGRPEGCIRGDLDCRRRVRKPHRLFRMVDEGRLPAEFLRGIEYRVGSREPRWRRSKGFSSVSPPRHGAETGMQPMPPYTSFSRGCTAIFAIPRVMKLGRARPSVGSFPRCSNSHSLKSVGSRSSGPGSPRTSRSLTVRGRSGSWCGP